MHKKQFAKFFRFAKLLCLIKPLKQLKKSRLDLCLLKNYRNKKKEQNGGLKSKTKKATRAETRQLSKQKKKFY